MSSLTDVYNFNNSKLFETIRVNGLPLDKEKTQNLLECKDDLLFVWHSGDCCVLVVNWRAAQTKGFDEIKYQMLFPTTTQNFQVDKLLSSPEGSLIALAGTRGLSILELPRRWGSYGQFLEGKEKITCKSHNLDEYFFVNNTHLQLLQIRWHPASPTDSHILALLSDNSIRIYDDAVLKHVWRVGPVPSALLSGTNETQLSTLHSFGEIAVDFDILPPRVIKPSFSGLKMTEITDESKFTNISGTQINDSSINSSTMSSTMDRSRTKGLNSSETGDKNKIEWPIVIIRGNGNVYILCAGIDTEKPHLEGPLTILPQAMDNFGVDYCSVLVIPTLPTTLIMAETTGKLHHALLLETESPEDSFNEVDTPLNIYPSEWSLNILETIELELGMSDGKKENAPTCPVHLKRDFLNEARYFAYHNTGIHAVVIGFIKDLQRFLEPDESVSPLSFSNPSRAEYVVCTKVEDRSRTNAVLGLALLQMPTGIVLLLSSGQVISLKLIVDSMLLSSWETQLTMTNEHNTPSKLDGSSSSPAAIPNSPIQKIRNEFFTTHIRNILQKTVTQPLLSLDKSTELTPEEAYELLTQSIDVLKEQYFKKHERARVEILKRMTILKLLRQQQLREIENLEREKTLIRQDAERLAEKFDDINEKQQIISKKCQDLLRQANVCLPGNNAAEKEFTENVEKINETTKTLAKALKRAQEQIKIQQLHIKRNSESMEMKKIDLPEKQESAIKQILMQITEEIDAQIKDVKTINSILN